MEPVLGILVSASRDSNTLLVEYTNTDPDHPPDVRRILTSGDSFRVGGLQSSGVSDPNIDGSSLYQLLEVEPESPILYSSLTKPPLVLPGETLRIGADNYNVIRSGEEVQVVSVDCGSAGSTGVCGTFRLRLFEDGVSDITSCIQRLSNQDMTTAAELQSYFNALSNVRKGDIVVTRAESVDGRSYVFSIYFEGPSVFGDVVELYVEPGCGAVSQVADTTVTVATVVNGGFVEVQSVSVNVESGYIERGLFQLQVTSPSSGAQLTTDCINFGASSSDLELALQSLSVITDQSIPNILLSGGPTTLVSSQSIYGILSPNSVISITDSVNSQYVTVTSVSNGLTITVTPDVNTVLLGPGPYFFSLYHSDAVQVARYGTGNSTASVVRVTQTADEYVDPSTKGFFKLRMIIDGDERVTSQCIPYHATASEFQAAINSLQYDFNGDSQYTGAGDNDHVLVTRSGDGSVTSGFGYVYTVRFSGPQLSFGRTQVMGNLKPFLQIIDVGHIGGCFDLNSTFVDSFTINATLSTGNSLTMAFSNGVQTTTAGLVQAGDRIRLPYSTSPYKTFVVTDVTAYTLVVDNSFSQFVKLQTQDYLVSVVKPPFPEYAVETVQDGEDSYTYEIFFTGSHLTNVDPVAVNICPASSFSHYGGMRYGVTVRTTQNGGSEKVETLTLRSRSLINPSTSGYFKLVYNGNSIVSPATSNGFPWGVSAQAMVNAIAGAPLTVSIEEVGTGSVEELEGYTYTITYSGLLSGSVYGQLPTLSAVGDGQISLPVYALSNASTPTANDITVSGVFNSSTDGTFVVTISSVNSSSADTFTWTVNGGASSQAVTIVAGQAFYLTSGVSVSFLRATGHNLYDSWTFSGVRCDLPLPPDTLVEVRVVRTGNQGIQQIVVSPGYEGTAYGVVTAFKVAPQYTVQDQSPVIWKVLTNDPATVSQPGLAYRFTFYDVDFQFNMSSSCVNWNANDYEVEAALIYALQPLCNSTSNCVSVTRGVDNINNAGGYVYSIYFENAEFDKEIDFNLLQLNQTDCNAANWKAGSSLLSISSASSGVSHLTLSSTQVPLGLISDSSISANYRGPSVSRVPLYKINGNSWAVTFSTNLGNLPLLEPLPTRYLTTSTQLGAVEVVQGEHPLSYTLTGLQTGILYSARVEAYTRGPYHGYGNYTRTDEPVQTFSAIPSGVPPGITDVQTSETLLTPEVQQVFVSASHLQEIQTITTSAPAYPEVQEITITAPEGTLVEGNFSVRYPEVQRFQIRASGSTLLTGYVSYTYTYFDKGDTTTPHSSTSSCVPIAATAVQVKNALEGISRIDEVEVVRSGYGGFTSYYGYTWDISFTGNLVAGDVQLLTVGYGTTSSSCTGAFPTSLTPIVTTLNPDGAVGIDTEIQTLTVFASTDVVQGQFQLIFMGVMTECLQWNASETDVAAALEGLSTIDSVIVQRFGDGTSASNYGYTYSIYFNGNSLHLRDDTGSLDLLEVTNTAQVGYCGTTQPFGYFVGGVLTNFTTSTAGVTVTRIQSRGYNMIAASTSASILTANLALLPTFVNVYDIRRSLSDDQLGFKYSVVFGLSMGNAPSLVCGTDATFQGVGATCGHETIVEGNFIGGYFIVGTSALLPSNVSAVEMQNELQLLQGIGNVSVTRSGPDFQGGFTWTVTWLTAVGNQPPLAFSSSLTGSDVVIFGKTVQDGNYLGGSFALGFNGKISSLIPYSASDAEVARALNPVAGLVSVTKSAVDTEGGASYLVTFLGFQGDAPLLVPQYQGTLAGVNAVVFVQEIVKGSLASGSTLKLSFTMPLYCSQSQVPVATCGEPVETVAISVGDVKANGVTIQDLSMNVPYTVQIIRVSSPPKYDPLSFSNEAASGSFRLTYNGATTGPISAGVSAVGLRDALEALPDVQTVAVTRSYSAEVLVGTVTATQGSQVLKCNSATCGFSALTSGDLVRVGGLWFKVAHGFKGSSTRLPLALQNDSSIITFYNGTDLSNAPLYRWARGYEWSVTFLKVSTKNSLNSMEVLPLSSPKHSLNPLDSALSIRAQDCINCVFISNLAVWNEYFIQVRAVNVNGFGSYSGISGIPKEIPLAPSSIIATTVSGTKINVKFAPPTGVNSQITEYIIQWDTNPDFTNVENPANVPSCLTSGFGQCPISGAAISVIPPFSFMIENLAINVKYFVRVAARNSVSIQRSDPTGTIRDNTNWSGTAWAVTSNQAPSAPVEVITSVAGLRSIQVLITPPLDDGGVKITEYFIEWDGSINFDDSTTSGKFLAKASDLPVLSASTGQLVYNIDGLSTGVSYWVRVSAANVIGNGTATITAEEATPAGKPSNPASVLISTATVQPTPVTTAQITWTEPIGNIPDGGNPISEYLVEWWTANSVAEVQLLQFFSDNFPSFSVTDFLLTFGPQTSFVESTGSIPYSVSAFNLRSELMNMGYAQGFANNFTYDFLIGNVNVEKSIITNKGYQWAITFLSDTNVGNQVAFVPQLSSLSPSQSIAVIEKVKGQRSQGNHEVQLLTIISRGSNSSSDLGGWFTLSFNGSESTTIYLPVDASGADVQTALAQLNTLRAVTVTQSVYSFSTGGAPYAGYRWTIVFSGDVGDQPAINVDVSLVYTSAAQVLAWVDDGDNSLSRTGSKNSTAIIGELAVGYNARTVDRDTRSFTIPNLVPGETYFVAVSAVNNYGIGASTLSNPVSITPPKQIPQPPTQVSVAVHPGSSTSLDVSFQPPLSDGGSEILSYRVELDTTLSFPNPIHTVFYCPSSSLHSVYQITTSGNVGDPIVSGFYNLSLSFNGRTFYTDNIAYDATATLADETGLYVDVRGVVAKPVVHNSDTVTASRDARALIFPGDRLQFSNQLFPGEVFTVVSLDSVTGKTITLDKKVQLNVTSTDSPFIRVLGGRGLDNTARVACSSDPTLCPSSRIGIAGSVQSKFELIPEALIAGVDVDRDTPDQTNGVTWRVTFLDSSPVGSLNYAVAVSGNQLKTLSGATANISVALLIAGQNYLSCTGTFQVPQDKALANGQSYYSRVFALNEVGYSLPQVSSTSQKPQVVPGPPTSVSLTVFSSTAITVSFNPPSSDGGDPITSYRIDYSTSSSFVPFSSINVTQLQTGATFRKTITNLQTGVFYYFRVSAMNTQGYGLATLSTPASLNPYQAASAPTNVVLAVTSDTMLTVSFGQPLDNGGDVVTGYRVEWDTSSGFNSNLALPNKGYVDVLAATSSSYTITYLTQGQVYYVRVFAKNNAGLGTPAAYQSAAPGLQIPGRPQTLSVSTGIQQGQIKVSWLRPSIPWHNIPCFGLPTNPGACPAAVGGSVPESDGGTPIVEYAVSYNELEDFSGFDGGEITTTKVFAVLTGLTPGRLYYVRVLARNAQGSGLFCAYTDPNCLIVSNSAKAVAKAIIA